MCVCVCAQRVALDVLGALAQHGGFLPSAQPSGLLPSRSENGGAQCQTNTRPIPSQSRFLPQPLATHSLDRKELTWPLSKDKQRAAVSHQSRTLWAHRFYIYTGTEQQ